MLAGNSIGSIQATQQDEHHQQEERNEHSQREAQQPAGNQFARQKVVLADGDALSWS